MTPETHAVTLAPFALPLTFALEGPTEEESWKLPGEYVRNELLLLKYPISKLLKNMDALPVPGKYDDTTWGPPRRISMGLLSSWLHGREPIPAPRLAGIVALLELHCLEWGIQLEEGRWADQFMRKRIALAIEHHKLLASTPEVAPYLTAYRLAIFAKLKQEKGKSPARKKLYAAYRESLPQEMRDAVASAAGH